MPQRHTLILLIFRGTQKRPKWIGNRPNQTLGTEPIPNNFLFRRFDTKNAPTESHITCLFRFRILFWGIRCVKKRGKFLPRFLQLLDYQIVMVAKNVAKMQKVFFKGVKYI
jgi:hypothetical protein